MFNADYFAYHQYRDYVIYKALAEIEPVAEFKKILEELIEQEHEDYVFWRKLSHKKTFAISQVEITLFTLARKVLGLTFTAKFLEGREKGMIQRYSQFLQTVDAPLKQDIARILKHEREHEGKLISQIKEERIEFLGNVVLGLNDGLIELSGALVGFSFAFANSLFVAFSGVIVGLSAALSMASSAYMQARHEEGKNPPKAALYTGLAYLGVVVILVTPFFVCPHIAAALVSAVTLIALTVIGLSFYSSVLLERQFLRQVTEMLAFSVGVAVVTFVIGSLVRRFIPALSIQT